MKRKGLVLDFTSFLDVMLILIFIVIVNMNQVSLSANEASDKALTEAQTQLETIRLERDALTAEINLLQENANNYAALQEEYEALEQRYAALEDDYDYLRITSDYDVDDMSVYQAAIERMTKVALICSTGKNAETGNYEVTVDIYIDQAQIGEQSYVDTITITHNFNLTKEERARLNSQQVVEATRVLSRALRNQENSMVWFSIQYAYDDENFSHSDLEILTEAISNLEHSFSISCYAEKIKLY